MTRYARPLRGSLALLLAAGLAAGCGRREAPPAAESAAVEGMPVEVLDIDTGDFALELELSGSTEALREVDISAELAGTVLRYDHELGDELAAGELILALDARPFRALLDQAESALIAANSARRQAERELERSRVLKERGRISDVEFEAVELRHEQARSAALGTEAARDLAALQLEDTEVRAPFAGRLAYKGVEMHEQVAPGLPVAAVADLSGILIRAGVGEQEAVRIRRGMPARVTLPALGEVEFPGRVRAVGVRSHPATRSYEVEIEVSNAAGRILSGMAARVAVIVEQQASAVSLPVSAIVEQYGKPVAFVVEDGVARRRDLELGARSGDHQLVRSGLVAGDRLIVRGQWSVRDGLAVAVKN